MPEFSGNVETALARRRVSAVVAWAEQDAVSPRRGLIDFVRDGLATGAKAGVIRGVFGRSQPQVEPGIHGSEDVHCRRRDLGAYVITGKYRNCDRIIHLVMTGRGGKRVEIHMRQNCSRVSALAAKCPATPTSAAQAPDDDREYASKRRQTCYSIEAHGANCERPPALISLDIQFLDEDGPLRIVVMDDIDELLTRHSSHFEPLLGEFIRYLRVGKDLVDTVVNFLHDLGWSASRGEHRVPGLVIESLHAGFGESGQIGQRGRPAASRSRDRPHLP